MTCQTCHAPTDSTYLCHRCAADLTGVLEQIPDALATVQDTVARLDRVGTGTGRGTEASRPPVNLDALEHQTHLTELVHSWARMVLESETRNDLRDVEPVTYLRMSVHLIIAQDFAGEMHAELKDALRKVVRAADLPGDPVWLGRCAVTYDDGTKCTGEIRGWMIADDRPGRKPGARRLAEIAKCTECKSPCDARQVYANHILRAASYSATCSSQYRCEGGVGTGHPGLGQGRHPRGIVNPPVDQPPSAATSRQEETVMNALRRRCR